MTDVVCVGETMVSLTPIGEPLADAASVELGLAGAESNVAANLAALGCDVVWASRLGDDPFGRRIADDLSRRGIRVEVELDPIAPTGLLAKDPSPSGSRVHYYRRGSAAAAMDEGFVGADLLRGARIVHTTGITPALSASCSRMVERLFADARTAGALVSFDVNDRRPLWDLDAAARTLAHFAEAADICFVGRDEAERLWGTATAGDIRSRLPRTPVLVVKDADVGATAYRGSEPPVFVPAPPVDVIEPVGAGDAFAAGFLAGHLGGADLAACLSAGHASAALVLASHHDLIPWEGTR